MTNNIQKAFKTKSKLRGMVDGGSVRPAPEMLGSGMAQRAGSLLQGRRAQIDAEIDAASGAPPPPAPATAAPAKKPEEKSALRSFFGLADGGKVKGKGGPTDDKVGPVMLSDGEYVLPADTVDIVGRDKLDALRLATHDFVDEDNKPKVSGLRKMVNGGPAYADPEDVANRRLLSGGLGQPPQTAAGSSGGGGRGLVPHQPTAAGSPGGGGRGLVPYQPPTAPSTAMVPYEPPVTKVSPTEVPRPQAGGSLLRSLLGKAGLVANVASAIPAADASVGEWARGIPEVLRGGSAPQPNTKVRFLDGQPTPEPVFNPTVEELDRRGALRPESIDDALENLRSGDAPGGGFRRVPGTDVYRRNNPNAGNPGESARQYVGVGTPERQTEDPVMSELRSALRGLGTQQSSGGGTSAFSRKAMADINKRYDDLLRSGSGRNRVNGLDWSQRHGLDLERARASELGEFARNQSALRGQDVAAGTAANNAANQARMQAVSTLGSLANQRAQQAASGGAAALRAMNDAARLEGQGEDRLDQRANRAVDELTSFAARLYGEDSPEGRDFEMAFRATNPDFMTMPDGDRASLLAQFREQWDAQAPVRERAAALGRPIGVGQAPMMSGDPVSVGMGDWANGRATFGDWMESFNLFGPNDATARVVPDSSGGINMLVSEEALTTRKDGSKRADVISRLRTGDK